MTDHFFVHERLPYLTVMVCYREVASDERKRYSRQPPERDPREELDEAERGIYDALKAWRGARAKAEGIPAYMIAAS